MSDTRNTVLAAAADSDALRARNRRTGLALGGVALAFFAAVILKYALHWT